MTNFQPFSSSTNYIDSVFDPSQFNTIMNVINQPAFIHALSADWKVGYQLWKNLTQELQKQVTDIRREHLPMDLGGNQTNQGGQS